MTVPRCEKCHVPLNKDLFLDGTLGWTCRRCHHFNMVRGEQLVSRITHPVIHVPVPVKAAADVVDSR